MALVPVETVLLNALAMKGKPYVFGAEAKASDPSPSAFDCSELVEWSCGHAGVPGIPDGAYNQWQLSKRRGLLMPVPQGVRTRGALLWAGDGTGTGRDAIVHVAWSLGDGTTIEARGKAWGVGSWPAARRFTFAGLLPGIDYTPAPPPFPIPDPPEADMSKPLTFIACSDPAAGELQNAGFKTDGIVRSWVPTIGHAKKLRELGLLEMNGEGAFSVGPDFIRELLPATPSDNHPGTDRLHDDDIG